MPGLNSMFYTQGDPSFLAGGDDGMAPGDGMDNMLGNVSLTQYEPSFWEGLGFSGPAYFEGGENGREITPQLRSFMEEQGIRPGVSQGRGGMHMAGLVGRNGQPITGSTYLNAPNDNLFFSLASGALNPFGGFLAGKAAAAGLGSVSGSLGLAGKAAGAFNGAVTGGINAAGTGGDIGRAVAAGTLAGGYTPDVAGMTGMGNGTLGQIVNAGVKGGAQAAISGGNVGQAAGLGGLFAGLNTIGGDGMEGGYSRAPWASNSPGFNEAAGLPGNDVYGSTPAPWATPQMNFGMAEDNPSSNPLGDFLNKLLPTTAQGQVRLGDMTQGLLGMYSGYRRQRMAKEMMGRAGGNRDSYLANLRGQLQARDARSGRRSNYSGRETELQGKLAELDSRTAPAMAQLSDARFSGLESMLASGLRMGNKMEWFGPREAAGNTISGPGLSVPGYTAPRPAPNPEYSLVDQYRRNRFGG